MPVHIFLIIICLLSGCTVKLNTDLGKLIGTDNPQQFMASSEAQQIATRIGEGMGTKIMEGEVLAEEMGKGLGEVFLRPAQVAVITDPVSRELIEKGALDDIRTGNMTAAIQAFKRTNNLARLEEIALILFDRGQGEEAADLHQYLIDHAWPIRAPYLVAQHVERDGLATISTPSLKEIDPRQYNLNYISRSHAVFDTTSLREDFIRQHTLTRENMIQRLKASPVVILADAYFDTRQHDFFLEIITALYHKNLVIGLERTIADLKETGTSAELLHYLPLIDFIKEKNAATFTHGPTPTAGPVAPSGTIDFFQWDSALAATALDLMGKKKQVLLIVGNTHAASAHLPFLIEHGSGIDPVIVAQSLLNTHAQDWPEQHGAVHKSLTAWGAVEGSVISIDNDFYLNTPLSPGDFERYTELFALTPGRPVQ